MNENFTTYTENDVGNYISETAPKVTATADPTSEATYLYYDKTANHFDALNIDFEFYVTDPGASPYGKGGPAITNTLSAMTGFASTDFCVLIQGRLSSVARLWLFRGNTLDANYWDGSTGTIYYCKIQRTAGNDTVTCKIFLTAADRLANTNIQATLSVSGFGATKWQYSMGFTNYDDGTPGRPFTGYVQNMNLNEGGAARLKQLSILGVGS